MNRRQVKSVKSPARARKGESPSPAPSILSGSENSPSPVGGAASQEEVAESTTAVSNGSTSRGGIMPVWVFLVLYVVSSTAIPIYLHHKKQKILGISKLNIFQCLLSFFLPLNILINFWEISLGIYIDYIKETYLNLARKYGNQRMNAVNDWFFNESISLSQIFSFKYWSRIWATYSLYDPSYSNKESFGFFIDVGNGWSTILPSLVFLFAMTCEEKQLNIPGWSFFNVNVFRVIGLIGFATFYQELYGTIIYFLSFLWNKRYEGKTNFEVALFVGLSNGLWFFFPLVGMYCSYFMIVNNNNEKFLK